MRGWWAVVGVLAVVACGGDDKKSKKADKPKVTSPAKRAELACEAACARGLRCDEQEMEPCMKACRLERTRHMHVYRERFVVAYSDCLDSLPCGKDVERCQAIAVAVVLEPPKDPDEDDASKDEVDEGKSDDKGKSDGNKKNKKKKKKKKKKTKKTKKDREAEKKREKERVAAEAGRALFERCHARRIVCDGSWNERCNAAGALTDGGRDRVRACLRLPCSHVRACLQEALSW